MELEKIVPKFGRNESSNARLEIDSSESLVLGTVRNDKGTPTQTIFRFFLLCPEYTKQLKSTIINRILQIEERSPLPSWARPRWLIFTQPRTHGRIYTKSINCWRFYGLFAMTLSYFTGHVCVSVRIDVKLHFVDCFNTIVRNDLEQSTNVEKRTCPQRP